MNCNRPQIWKGRGQLVITALASLIGFMVLVGRASVDGPSMCFTPAEDCPGCIVRQISAAKSEMLVQAYGFTNTAILNAISKARERGVFVRAILDRWAARHYREFQFYRKRPEEKHRKRDADLESSHSRSKLRSKLRPTGRDCTTIHIFALSLSRPTVPAHQWDSMDKHPALKKCRPSADIKRRAISSDIKTRWVDLARKSRLSDNRMAVFGGCRHSFPAAWHPSSSRVTMASASW